jgi:hypothetical protein
LEIRTSSFFRPHDARSLDFRYGLARPEPLVPLLGHEKTTTA